MENFIEKLKTVDKKVWIGVGIGAAVLIILIVALVIAGGKKKPNTDTQNTEISTETEAGATEVFGTEDVTEVIGTEMTTETEMGTETEMTESESQAQNNGGGTTSNVVVTQPESVGGVEQKPITITPEGEMMGDGSAANPYMPQFNSSMSYNTLAISAGQTAYYSFRGAGNMWFTIEDADAYVIVSSGKRYDAENGKVSFKVENAMDNEYVVFQIGNKSGSAKAFTIKFANLKGSKANPESLNGNGPFTKHLNAGDEVGYYFKVDINHTGAVRIYMSATANTIMNAQVNKADPNAGTPSRCYNTGELTEDMKTDEKGRNYIELPVEAGDDLVIHVQADKPTRGSIPATDITFELAYY